MKNRFIVAYTWAFGCSKAEAMKAYKKADSERINLIVVAFEKNAAKSFNDD